MQKQIMLVCWLLVHTLYKYHKNHFVETQIYVVRTTEKWSFDIWDLLVKNKILMFHLDGCYQR